MPLSSCPMLVFCAFLLLLSVGPCRAFIQPTAPPARPHQALPQNYFDSTTITQRPTIGGRSSIHKAGTVTTIVLGFSAVASRTETAPIRDEDDDRDDENSIQRPPQPQLAQPAVQLSEEEYLLRLEAQLEKLRLKDLLSPLLTKEVSLSAEYESRRRRLVRLSSLHCSPCHDSSTN